MQQHPHFVTEDSQMKKTSVSVALAACALAVPSLAVAHGKPEGVGGERGHHAEKAHGKAEHRHGKSHKCQAHSVGYVFAGTVADAAVVTKTDDGYAGTLTIEVTRANRWARALKGTRYGVKLDGARVRLGKGVTTSVPAGARVQVIGKVTSVAKKCADPSKAGVVTLKKVVLKAVKDDATPETGEQAG
jgi:hypothetical protein